MGRVRVVCEHINLSPMAPFDSSDQNFGNPGQRHEIDTAPGVFHSFCFLWRSQRCKLHKPKQTKLEVHDVQRVLEGGAVSSLWILRHCFCHHDVNHRETANGHLDPKKKTGRLVSCGSSSVGTSKSGRRHYSTLTRIINP